MLWPTKTYLVSPKYRLLYCPIPKVACSSLKLWLFELEEGPQEALRQNPHHHTHLHNLKTHGRGVARRALRERDWFRFAFVRNPWARLASAFANKFLSKNNPVAVDFFRGYHAWQRGQRRWRKITQWLPASLQSPAAEPSGAWRDDAAQWGEEFTFRRFVEFLGRSNLHRVNEHWRPQSLFLAGARFDFIGRFEDLPTDFERIRQHAGVPGRLGIRNQTSIDPTLSQGESFADSPLSELRKLPAVPPYRALYTPDLVDSVARLYHRDVRRFGYSF